MPCRRAARRTRPTSPSERRAAPAAATRAKHASTGTPQTLSLSPHHPDRRALPPQPPGSPVSPRPLTARAATRPVARSHATSSLIPLASAHPGPMPRRSWAFLQSRESGAKSLLNTLVPKGGEAPVEALRASQQRAAAQPTDHGKRTTTPFMDNAFRISSINDLSLGCGRSAAWIVCPGAPIDRAANTAASAAL